VGRHGLQGQPDAAADEAVWAAAAPELDEIQGRLLEGREARRPEGRPQRIRDVFGLDRVSWALFRGAAAGAIDPEIGAALGGRGGAVREAEVRRIFGLGPGRMAGAASPLLDWELLRVQESDADGPLLSADPVVVEWLMGRTPLDPALRLHISPVSPRRPLAPWPVVDTASWFRRALDGGPAVRTRLVVSGPPGAGRRTFAACVARALGFDLLAVHPPADVRESAAVVRRGRRQAFLDEVALAWCGPAASAAMAGPSPDAFPFEVLICLPEDAPAPGGIERRVELGPPSVDERRALWMDALPASRTWEPADLYALAERHRSTPGEIMDAAREPLTKPDEAAAAVRARSRHRLGDVAQRLSTPFEWDDLVVDPGLREGLEDLVHEVGARETFWERAEARRLFPQGRGVVALFTGPPGTGKTMAAQVTARAMGRDLFRVDLSAVVSKYVGETSKNLRRVLHRAAHTDAVLFFDEADALFGRRTEIQDAHDRYANTDTDYLLQALEAYEGVAVLATNRKGNVDPAFLRRLRFVLDFPLPDADHRTRLWATLVEALHGLDAPLRACLERLAREVELSGAQIKGAVLTGVFRARRYERTLSVADLVEGVIRELAKEGRVVGARERERLVGHG
jgi:MoxR-like ATPase